MGLRDRSHDIEDFPSAFLVDDREIGLGSAGSLGLLVLSTELGNILIIVGTRSAIGCLH